MSIVQKWVLGLLSLGAAYLVATKPDAFYKAASGARSLIAGSIVDVTTGGRGGR